jgi:hypothetical protein
MIYLILCSLCDTQQLHAHCSHSDIVENALSLHDTTSFMSKMLRSCRLSLFPDSCYRLNTLFRFNLETKTSDSIAIFHSETELTNNNNKNVDMKVSAHDAFMQ